MTQTLQIASSIQFIVMLSNLCFVLVVYHSPSLQVSFPQYFHHCSVAISGIVQAFGTWFLLSQMTGYRTKVHKDPLTISNFCKALSNIKISVSIVLIVVDFSFYVSYFSLFLAAFQRFYLSTFPFRYNKNAWKKNLNKVILAPWFTAIFLLTFEVSIYFEFINVSSKLFSQVFFTVVIVLITLLMVTSIFNTIVFKRNIYKINVITKQIARINNINRRKLYIQNFICASVALFFIPFYVVKASTKELNFKFQKLVYFVCFVLFSTIFNFFMYILIEIRFKKSFVTYSKNKYKSLKLLFKK